MLTNDFQDLVSYRQQDLLAEVESERLVAQLPARTPLELRQRLARICYRLARWLDERELSLGEPAHEHASRSLRSILPAATPRVRAEPPLYAVEAFDIWDNSRDGDWVSTCEEWVCDAEVATGDRR